MVAMVSSIILFDILSYLKIFNIPDIYISVENCLITNINAFCANFREFFVCFQVATAVVCSFHFICVFLSVLLVNSEFEMSVKTKKSLECDIECNFCEINGRMLKRVFKAA